MSTGQLPVLADVKDFVREHLARTTFPTEFLDRAIDGGRRYVEKEGNWWWMRAPATPVAVVNQQNYTLDDSAPTGWAISSFKDAKALMTKKSADTEWSPMEFGTMSLDEATLHWATDDDGIPELAILDNRTIKLFPPKPDVAYQFTLFYWQWTLNPALNTGSDDLIKRFPEALKYASMEYACEMELKDYQAASYWKAKLREEVIKIRRHNFLREQQDKITIVPMTGPNQRVRRLRLTSNIWIGSN